MPKQFRAKWVKSSRTVGRKSRRAKDEISSIDDAAPDLSRVVGMGCVDNLSKPPLRLDKPRTELSAVPRLKSGAE
jgi:hypothetical protein